MKKYLLENIVDKNINKLLREFEEPDEKEIYLSKLDEVKNMSETITDKLYDFIYDYSKYMTQEQYQIVSETIESLENLNQL